MGKKRTTYAYDGFMVFRDGEPLCFCTEPCGRFARTYPLAAKGIHSLAANERYARVRIREKDWIPIPRWMGAV